MTTPAPRMSSTFMSFDISQDAEANTASVELPDDTVAILDEHDRPMSGKIWDGAWGTWKPNYVGPSNKSEEQIFYNLAGWWSYVLPNAQVCTDSFAGKKDARKDMGHNYARANCADPQLPSRKPTLADT